MIDIPQLEHLFFYTTWECNLRCRHCWVGKYAHTPTQLTIDVVENAIDQALSFGLRHIKLSGGEPLLTRSITRCIVEKASANGISVNIETNGTLLDEEWADFLVANSVSVSISIDSVLEEEHDTFRGMQGAFRSSLCALDLMFDRGQPAGVVMSISSPDYFHIEQMIQLCASHNAAFLKINPIVRIGRAEKANNDFIFSLTPEEMLKIKNKYGGTIRQEIPVYLMFPFGLSATRHILKFRNEDLHCGNCPTLNLLSIMPNGDFGLCADAELHEQLHFGNIFEQDLSTVWSSHPKLQSLRKVVPEQLEGVCGQCMAKSICQGSCRAIAVSDGGKLTSPHPICRRLHEEKKFPLAID